MMRRIMVTPINTRIKPETSPVIRSLLSAKMKIAMITGDNINTAISVAKDCGMVLPGRNKCVCV